MFCSFKILTSKKYGISDFVRDYWVVGYTNDTVISLWLGYDEISNKYDMKVYYFDFSELEGNIRHELRTTYGFQNYVTNC